MAKRLWDKGDDINELVHRFTVGDDPVTDLELAPYDLLGSAAHARMLARVGLLTQAECQSLIKGLKGLSDKIAAGEFSIPVELEDCHTTIEAALTESLGDTGKKIHTGRSRNDQVLLAVRLFMRSKLGQIQSELLSTAETLLARAEEFSGQPMPGYTHLQAAMPSSVQMWLQAFAESFLELSRETAALWELLNANPLGAASGFGTNLPLDREFVTNALGFNRTQRNPIAVQNSRGSYELKVLRLASDIAGLIEKLSWDLIIFNTAEFKFVVLPDALTTGSSIMPQKRNPDVLELLRARAAKARGAETELALVIAKLPSNYHRDFQFTKEPLVRGLRNVLECLPIFREVIGSFKLNRERLNEALTDDLFSTYEAYKLVREGTAFREAYKLAATRSKEGKLDRKMLEQEFKLVDEVCQKELLKAKEDLATAKAKLLKWEELEQSALRENLLYRNDKLNCAMRK